MNKLARTAMIFAALTMAGYGQAGAPAAGGSFEQFWADAQKENRADKSEASQSRMAWWRDARFGMFIHWNMCSLMGTEISFSRESYDGGLGNSDAPNPRAALAKGSEFEGWVDWMKPSVPKVVYDNLY
ncbi:MAG: alpha-L-fucosidase, partial [Methanosarcinaceae archaeon]|nr:alpha-L-fucosidase [Methanosarcinaceae archaeon]